VIGSGSKFLLERGKINGRVRRHQDLVGIPGPMQCKAGSKLGELVIPRHCRYFGQSWVRKRLKHILSILNTLLYFLQLVFIFFIVFVTAIIVSVIVPVVIVVIVITVFIIFIVFVTVIIVSVSIIVITVIALNGIATDEGQNIRKNNANHR